MSPFMAVLAVLWLCLFATAGYANAYEPDVSANTEQLITSKGYPHETHWVTTEDGYILKMTRITGGRGSGDESPPNASAKPPALLMHGLLDTADTWVINFPEESLAFILADHGYDVWLGNSRGNTYSTNHTTLDTSSQEFWAFSFDQMASYDIPTFVDFVLSYSNYDKLSYIGHSQGTIQAFVSAVTSDYFSQKVNYFGALAPVAFAHHQKSIPFRIMADIRLDIYYKLMGRTTYGPASGSQLKKLLPWACEYFPLGCEDIIFLLAGFNGRNLNQTRLDVYVSHTPSTTSVQNMAHWAQEIRRNEFGAYDYGCPAENMKHYGQSSPPSYQLKNFPQDVPLHMFSGSNDYLADPADVQQLMNGLPTEAMSSFKNSVVEEYEHFDFVWGENAWQLVYTDLLLDLEGIWTQ